MKSVFFSVLALISTAAQAEYCGYGSMDYRLTCTISEFQGSLNEVIVNDSQKVELDVQNYYRAAFSNVAVEDGAIAYYPHAKEARLVFASADRPLAVDTFSVEFPESCSESGAKARVYDRTFTVESSLGDIDVSVSCDAKTTFIRD